jgi:hypothetical protein
MKHYNELQVLRGIGKRKKNRENEEVPAPTHTKKLKQDSILKVLVPHNCFPPIFLAPLSLLAFFCIFMILV